MIRSLSRSITKFPRRCFSTNVPRVSLNNGVEMPLLGMGTYTGGRFNQKCQRGEMKNAIITYFKMGGRMLDCASNYLNEDEIGEAITESISTGIIKRQDIFVTSKLNNPYHSPEHVQPMLEKSLLDLNLDYVDLYLMHWPTAFVHVPYDPKIVGFPQEYEPDQCATVTGVKWEDSHWDRTGRWPPHLQKGITIHDTWNSMVELSKTGLCRSIGVCNFQVQLLHELTCNTDHMPVVLQAESHPFLQQWGLKKHCKQLGIQFQSYSPLGYGMFKQDKEHTVMSHPIIKKIAEKHGKSPAQVALRWATQSGVGTNPLSLVPSEMEQNLDSFSFDLDEEDFKVIAGIDRDFHYLRPQDWYGLPYWN